MEDNRQLTFIREITEMEFDPEVFKIAIKLFSQYLTYSNENYKYNEMYLENFCQEFIKFKKFIQLKNEIVVELCEKILYIASDFELILLIDQFWVFSTKTGDISTEKNINEHKICSNKIQIKANLEFAEKKYLFFHEYEVIQKETGSLN